MIGRRAAIAGAAAALVPGGAVAQPERPLPRIAVVDPDRSLKTLVAARDGAPPGPLITEPGQWPRFFDELRRLGYVDGENIVIDLWSAFGVVDLDGRSDIINRIVASDPDVIVTRAGAWPVQLKELVTGIPIVTYSPYPLEFGIVANLGQPEANITGFGANPGVEIIGKWVQLLIELAPTIGRVAFAVGRRFAEVPGFASALDAVVGELAGQGIEMVVLPHDPPASAGATILRPWLEGVVARIVAGRFDGVALLGGQDFNLDYRRTAAAFLEAGLPTVSNDDYVRAGGLLGYDSSDAAGAYPGMARYVDRLLQGAQVADLPFQMPTRFALVINRRTASALGLTIPPSLLLRATEIIG